MPEGAREQCVRTAFFGGRAQRTARARRAFEAVSARRQFNQHTHCTCQGDGLAQENAVHFLVCYATLAAFLVLAQALRLSCAAY